MPSECTSAKETDPLVQKDVEQGGLLKDDTIQTYTEEAWDILKLAVPIFIARLSFVGMKTTDTALLGHVSREALSAAALSDLWTMCTTVLLSGRILGVLVGGAVGAGNPRLAGIYLQVSYVVLGGMALIVFTAWWCTEQVWLKFGSDPEISAMAGYYARVLSVAIPAIIGFGQLAQFFSAQRIMHPEKNSAMVGLVLNLALGMVFVLGFPFPNWSGYGFAACPIVTAAVSYVQLATLFFVYIYGQRLHESCWGGWQWKEITMDRIKTFCELYFPAALSSASDFWRVAVIGAVAAQLGEEEVAVFNTSYRIMWIALIFVGSMSGASAINMSLRLGKNEPDGAKQAGYVGVAMAAIMVGILSLLILVKSDWFGRIFTNDAVFLAMFGEASVPFTITLFFMNLAVAIERIPYSMGRTREVFWMGFVASWGGKSCRWFVEKNLRHSPSHRYGIIPAPGQVPGVILCIRYWRSDLVGLYTGMAIGYGMLVVLYSYIAFKRYVRR